MTHEELNAMLTRAEDAQNTGNYDEAEKLAQQVLDNVLIENVADRDGNLLHARASRILGVIAWRCGKYPLALEFLTTALNISEDNEDREGIAKALGSIGLVHLDLSDYTLALDYYRKALALDEELENKMHKALILGNIGVVHKMLSEYSLALDYFGKSLALLEELGSKEGLATVLGNIGNVHRNLSDYPNALDYLGKALALDEELDNKLGIARHLGNIGGVYRNLMNYQLALDYYGKALVHEKEFGNKPGLAILLGNIGGVYGNLSDYTLALDYFSKALVLYKELGNKAGVATNLGNIGLVHWNLSNYPLALDYFGKAFDLSVLLGNREGMARHLGNIGLTYSTMEFDGYDADKSEEFLLKAVEINSEIGAKHTMCVFHKNLSDLYATTDRWKESREHFEKYHTLYLEVQSEEATKQAQLMEHRRKIEESERDRQIKLARFQEQEKILHNILPAQIAERMVAGEKMIADSHDHVSVFFSDIVGFTKLSQQVTAEELVGMLNGIFSQFDQIARKHGLEKIKTIGDSYMAVAGAPIPQDNHAERAVLFSLEVSEFMENYRTDSGDKVELRIGIHTGSVVAGVIGENKFSYDMWGDAVNTASRMESHGEPSKIHVSEEFMRALSLSSILTLQPFQFVERGEIEIKGKGMMKTYYLEKRSIQ
ncbi:MAG: tetratricopeptide repeat protein [Ignavibacteria bacterium]|nr:tetratricopeptide repeat protein [Ignavibacteria bacterium]